MVSLTRQHIHLYFVIYFSAAEFTSSHSENYERHVFSNLCQLQRGVTGLDPRNAAFRSQQAPQHQPDNGPANCNQRLDDPPHRPGAGPLYKVRAQGQGLIQLLS